ncbi:MAG: serine/threonine-protein kinase [Planctomycetota bacterium]
MPPAPDPTAPEEALDAALRAAFGDAPADRVHPQDPERIGKFRVLRRLGEGGMGQVYAAQDESLGRRVALKSVRPEHRLDEATRARFLREARILSQLDHPDICTIHDYLTIDGGDYLVLELIEGRTLGELGDDELEGPARLAIAERLAEVLVRAHAEGVVHRDLKPSNVMLTPEGDVKVLDFGIARSPDEPSAEGHATVPTNAFDDYRTEQGSVLGTPGYMSPEQARGERVTTASDVYSLGLLLQELLTHAPIHPKGLSIYELWQRAHEGRSLPAEGAGRELTRLLERMKAPAASRRPTALEVAERLRWLRARPRRIAVRTSVAAGLLAVVGGAAKYTYDLGHERRLAVEAQNLAVLRRGQAEELIGFLLDDFRAKLIEAGKLELLLDAGERALAYFRAVPVDEWSEEERSRYSQLLYQLGEIWRERNDLPTAKDYYQRSLELARAVRVGGPEQRDRLGNSLFYVGQYHLEMDELDRARDLFGEYQEVCELNAELHPTITRLHEVAYAHTNLGAVQLRAGALPDALTSFDASIELWRGFRAEAPGEAELAVELADVLSWRASALAAQGDANALERALAANAEELDLRREAHAANPQNQPWARGMAIALSEGSRLLRDLERWDESRARAEEAVAAWEPIVEHDPENAEWRRGLAVAYHLEGRALLRDDRLAEAVARLEDAVAILAALAAVEGASADYHYELALARETLAKAQAPPAGGD